MHAQLDGTPTRILRKSNRTWAVLLLAVATFAVVVVAGLALRPGQDFGWARALNGLHVGAIGSIASAVYGAFEPVPSIALTAIVALVVTIRRGLRTGAAFAGVVALTWIPAALVKVIVRRDRPDVLLMPHPFYPVQHDPSFPSGHVAFIVAFVIAISLVAADTGWRRWVAVAGSVLVAMVAVALAVDAVHYPTDIIASVVWSLGVAPAARLVWVDWLMATVTAALDARPGKDQISARS